MSSNLEQARREMARWAILGILDAGRPVGVNGSLMLRILIGEKLLTSDKELRRELTYLSDLGLITIEQDENDEMSLAGKLTAAGVNVVEHTVPAPAGIARPAKS